MKFFPGFSRRKISTSGARINLVTGGKGPAVLLLHGYPETHVMWHKVAPALARDYTVVCADLRGYGDSGKPDGGENHAGYSKRAMAADQVEVMRALGFPRFRLAGHDRGARVVHRLFDPIADWRTVATDVRGKALPAGHFRAEEAPEETLAELLMFFAG